MAETLKVYCVQKEDAGVEDGSMVVSFAADPNQDNESWSANTPTASITFNVKADLVEGYGLGRKYAVTVTEETE